MFLQLVLAEDKELPLFGKRCKRKEKQVSVSPFIISILTRTGKGVNDDGKKSSI